MNCKPGDLAIFVGAHHPCKGMVVRVVRAMRWYDRLRPRCRNVIQPAWKLDPPLLRGDGRLGEFASDCALRPIRDNDGEDEMLRIVGKPESVEV